MPVVPLIAVLAALAAAASGCEPSSAPDVDEQASMSRAALDNALLYRSSTAVVIGINDYAHMPRLKGAERDAQAVGDALIKHGFNVRMLLGAQATRERIAALLGDELPRTTDRDDRIFVYFAGHGVSDGTGDRAIGYLLPAAGDRTKPASTGIAMTEMVRWFGRYQARQVMFVADACYSGLALSSRGVGLRPAMERYLQTVTSRPVRIAITAGAAGEQVNEWQGHGLFTHFLLQAFDGAADSNRDGVTTSDEIAAWIKPEVAKTAQQLWGTEQHPQSGRTGEGEFVFVHAPAITSVRGATRDVTNERATPRDSAAATPSGWVRVPPGAFMMGTPQTNPLRDPDEHHTPVRVDRGLLLSATELTQRQWRDVMGTNPSYFQGCGDNCPVEEITFWDALSYCNKRSEKEDLPPCYELHGCRTQEGSTSAGLRCELATFRGVTCGGYRLPTSEEWEYAARAGTWTDTYAGALRIQDQRRAPVLDAIAWHGGHNAADYAGAADCSSWSGRDERAAGCGSHPVGQLNANAWGLHDMIGNVWEWVWPRAPGGCSGFGDVSATSNDRAMCAGGGWYNDARDCRAANRFALPGNQHFFNIGMRLARSVGAADLSAGGHP